MTMRRRNKQYYTRTCLIVTLSIFFIFWLFFARHTPQNDPYFDDGADIQSGTKEAYVTFISTNDARYVMGALILSYSIRIHDQHRDLVAIVSKDVNSDVRALLKEEGGLPGKKTGGWIIREVESIPEYGFDSPVCRQAYGTLPALDRFEINKRWGKMFTKLRMWELDEYETILYLDADCLLIDDISPHFNKTTTQISAEPMKTGGALHSSHSFNAGVMYIHPSKLRFEHMLRAMKEWTPSQPKFPVDCTEQAFLNHFFPHFDPIKIRRPDESFQAPPAKTNDDIIEDEGIDHAELVERSRRLNQNMQTHPVVHWITSHCPKPWHFFPVKGVLQEDQNPQSDLLSPEDDFKNRFNDMHDFNFRSFLRHNCSPDYYVQWWKVAVMVDEAVSGARHDEDRDLYHQNVLASKRKHWSGLRRALTIELIDPNLFARLEQQTQQPETERDGHVPSTTRP